MMAKNTAHGLSLSSLLLPNDDPKVTAFLDSMQARRSKRRTNCGYLGSLRTGLGWEACFNRVQRVREYLAKEFGHEARAQFSLCQPTNRTAKFHLGVVTGGI